MRILLVNRALGTLFGGGESFDVNAARYLTARGHRVTLVTGKPIWGEPRNCFADLDVVYLPAPDLRRYAYTTEGINAKLSAAFYHMDNWIFERQVYRWLKQGNRYQGYDVVQCCSLFALPGWLINDLALPTVSWLPGPPSGRTRSAIRQLINHPHFGLFTHGSPKWTLNEMGLTEGPQFQIIEPGVELARIDQQAFKRIDKRCELSLASQDLLGITTARLVPVKQHMLLLDAIALALRVGVVWNWLIVGGGPMEKQLRLRVKGLGIEHLVHFTGYQQQSVVHQWLNSADVFVLTSSYENFSIATLEAMAHRLPIIGTDVGYLSYLIREADAGVVVQADDPTELGMALVDLSRNAKQREIWGGSGREYVEQFDWPLIAEKMERFYESVISGCSV